MSLSIKSIRSLVPLLDRVLVQRAKAQTQTSSGIFIPTKDTEQLPEAKVIAVGPGAIDKEGRTIPMNVKEGDRVLLPAFGGQTVKVGDEEYHLIRDADILAKLSE